MYSAENRAGRRHLVLGLIVLAHLMLGFLFFSSSGPAPRTSHRYSGGAGSAGGTGQAVRAATKPAKEPEAFTLSFDRSSLIGPSTYAPPSRAVGAMPKVAPSPHPS